MAKSKKKHAGGRPPKDVSEKLVRFLASIHCTNIEIAGATGVSVDTIERRFAGLIERYRANAKAKLRRKQFQAAMEKDDWRAQKWLGQQWLGQKNNVDIDTKPPGEDSIEVSFSWGDEPTPGDTSKDEKKR